jgi:DNA-binding GntR family transcriptional regulator
VDHRNPADGRGTERLAASTEHYLRLRLQLMTGQYPPGTLLQETSVSAATGVSRTPIRDALARLEQDGLLVRAPRGYRVRVRTAEEVLDIFEARIVLESHAAATAALRRSEVDLATLRHIIERARAVSDPQELWHADTDFHAALRAAARNDAVTDVLRRLDAQMSMHGPYVQRRSEAANKTVNEHELIVEAIAARDADLAGKRLNEHLSRVRDLRVETLRDELASGQDRGSQP